MLQIKLDLMLDWFVCFEAPLYLTLILSRLEAPRRVLQGVLVGAITLYMLSRLMQTIMLAYFFAATHRRMHKAGQQAVYWPCAILSCLLLLLQLYTAMIYRKVYRRAGADGPVVSSHPLKSSVQSLQAVFKQRPRLSRKHYRSASF